MKQFARRKSRRTATTRIYRFCVLVMVGAISIAGTAVAVAQSLPPANVTVNATADDKVAGLALHWFTEMQAGQIDRSQYVAAYRLQLTDNAVQEMSRALNKYGASPIGAEVVHNRRIGEQSFYIVKVLFPRGDETSLLLGLDSAGKITGIDIMSMAGD